MPFLLEKFGVDGLYGTYSYDIPIKDNKIVLIGENGTGKSTIASIMYYFLTEQWEELLNYKFKAINVRVNNEDYSFKYEDMNNYSKLLLIKNKLESISPKFEDNKDTVIKLSSIDDLSADLENSFKFIKKLKIEGNKKFSKKNKELNNNIFREKTFFLYLPTFRRIEQDIDKIFLKNNTDEIKKIKEKFSATKKCEKYSTLIEFGMEDVKNDINKKMEQIKDKFRTELNNMSRSYLKDVINRSFDISSTKKDSLLKIESQELDNMLEHIEEEILSSQEKGKIKNIVNKIKSNNKIEDKDNLIVHYLLKLLETQKALDKEEKDIKDFVNVCNNYLFDKKMKYDNVNFKINIEPNNIELQNLSSGEKQIVSLFSHIYLKEQKNNFIIIDEPELSLSVKWQQQLLPDILASNKCIGLISTTHSPFIFDNNLENYTYTITDFRR